MSHAAYSNEANHDGIVVVGSLNLDLFFEVERFPVKGETLTAQKFTTFPGGKGANQAVAAARLGANVKMIGCVGRDANGEILLENLISNNIDTAKVRQDAERATGLALVTVDRAAENTIILYAGANESCCREDITQAENVISTAKVMVLQLEIPLETVDYALEIAQKHQVTTILNPAPMIGLPQALLEKVDILILNAIEMTEFSGFLIEDVEAATRAAEAALQKGIRRIVITLGKRGVVFAGPEGILHVPAFTINAIDTTGAGDAFMGAFAGAWSQEMAIQQCLIYGCAAGAFASTKVGAQASLPYVKEIEEFLKNNK